MNIISSWIFGKTIKKLEKEYEQRLEEDVGKKVALFKASLDIKDVVRERLKVINPGRPEDNRLQDLIESFDTPERLEFLSKAHSIAENKTFKEVVTYLMSESMKKAALDASDIIEVNYQRAVVNGLSLLEEEIERLAKMYLDEKKMQEKMTLEESHEVI